jgi:3-methylfumaryl-CoA hydratase
MKTDNGAQAQGAEEWQSWVGREETEQDTLDLGTLGRVSAFFGRDDELSAGDPVPETWHWFFFLAGTRQDGLGVDGHPATGGFLPSMGLPRRMWGGSKLTFHAPLRAGLTATRRSRVASVDLKSGASGRLGIVRVSHEITQDGTLVRTEDQDILYRDPPRPGQQAAPLPCPEGAEVHKPFTPDAVTLFRFSALTYNAHRIHYDRDYATEEEGYPGLVVHGPLTASLLALLARDCRDRAPMTRFSFRGVSPLFDGRAMTCNLAQKDGATTLWAAGPDGGLAMRAEAAF